MGQEYIKHKLTLIDLEEVPLSPPRLTKLNFASFDRLSDWNDVVMEQIESKKVSRRLHPLAAPRYQSSIIRSDAHKERLQLSPVVVKFNGKYLSHNLNKSRQAFYRKIKEEPFSQQLSLNHLYEKKTHRQGPQRHDIFDGQNDHEQNVSVRVLKLLHSVRRHEPVRRKKNFGNPEEMTATRIY